MRKAFTLGPFILILVALGFNAVPALGDDVRDRFGDIESLFKQQQCGAPSGLLGGREPTARDYDWDVQHAEIHYWPDFDTETLSGTVLFTCQSMVAGLGEVALDFHDNMSVDALLVNGLPASYTHAGDVITITVNPPAAQDEIFTLAVNYSGSPSSSGFGSFSWDWHDGTHIVQTLSEPEGARDWWPCKDVPDDKFTADIYYRVPTEFSAPGPGLLQSVIDNGDGTHTWHWHESYLINSYLIALTVTNYAHYTDMYVNAEGDSLPIENYVFPENFDNSVEDLSITPMALALMDSVFSPYPFMDEKYGHMVFMWGGAMEHQTCTSYGYFLLGGDHWYDRIVVHELAHQWWGNSVTLRDWHNVWLNEGFASYGESIWFEYIGGQDGLTDWMTATTADPVFDGPVYDNPVLFSSTVYRKGAWVLHMLRFIMGDAAFFEALDYYYQQHEFDNADTADLQADLETSTGLDLETFFQQWVYGLYRPVYEWGWEVTGGPGNWWLTLQIRQVQDNTGLFVMPLPFRIATLSGDVDLRVDNEQWVQHYSIPMGADEPLGVEFDPENWVLENSTEVPYDPTAVDAPPATVTAMRGNFPNPFNPRTRIEFSLAEAEPVRLDVFDIEGRRVRTLIDGPRPTGPQGISWDGLDQRGRALPSGVYLARLRVADRVLSSRMTLLK